MADKKKNQILEDQRRAREEFIKLKKMQNGELDAGPKPSEVAIMPKTPKEKIANFWFQYKWHTIGLILSVSLFTVLVAQCMSRPNYDYNIVYFTYTPIIDTHTDLMSDYFEKYGKDLNGDGEVNISIVNCSVSDKSSDVRHRNTQLQKIQAMLMGEEKAMLYITDKDSIKYFDNIEFEGGVFEQEPLPLSEEFYKETESKELGRLPEGLNIACRKIAKTTLDKKETAKKVHTEAMRLIEELEKQNTDKK